MAARGDDDDRSQDGDRRERSSSRVCAHRLSPSPEPREMAKGPDIGVLAATRPPEVDPRGFCGEREKSEVDRALR